MKFQPVKGMKDFLPEEMVRRQYVLDIIRKIFEKWGYVPLETPALESFELLSKKGSGGEEIKREIYYFKDQGGRELGLRFDLSVPAARVLANNPNIPKPFKRYQIGRAWRYDQPQAGRYREFLQADIDIFGTSSMQADAEIIAVTCDVFKALGFKDFVIRINNRKIIEDFLKNLKVKDVFDVFRTIDKLEKIGEDEVIKELKEKGINNIEIIMDFIKTNKLSDDEGSKELEELIKYLKEFGYEKNIKIDFSLVRGLDYYTGPVFEVWTSGGKWGLAGGGRFDKMIELFGGPDTPATGISLGFERILYVMEQEKMFDLPKTNIQVFVAPVNDEVRSDALKISQELRKDSVSCDTDLMNRKLSKQLEFASNLGIPYVVIIGKEELKEDSVKLRNMKTGKEEIVKISEISKKL